MPALYTFSIKHQKILQEKKKKKSECLLLINIMSRFIGSVFVNLESVSMSFYHGVYLSVEIKVGLKALETGVDSVWVPKFRVF